MEAAEVTEGGKSRASRRQKPSIGLVYFQNASRLHHGRLLLTLGKPLGTLSINVDAGELLAVVVIHGHLPVAVLASSVPLKPAGTLCFGFRFFHDGITLNVRDYGKFD